MKLPAIWRERGSHQALERVTILLAVFILILIWPVHAAWVPDFWAGDCNCSTGSLPPLTESAATIDDTHSYFYAVSCDYGHYGNDLEANGKASHIQIRWDSPDAIAKRNAEKKKNILIDYESISSSRSPGASIIEYTPPGSDYVSLLYKKPSPTRPSTTFYSGERAIVYKSQYYIEIYGEGYGIKDTELKSLMNDTESCAKGIVDRQETRANRMAMEGTQTKSGSSFPITVLACLIGTAVLISRHRK